jgi:hypothetical protein
MGVNGINSATQSYESRSTDKTNTSQNRTAEQKNQKETDNTAAVYEKNEAAAGSEKKVYQRDNAAIDRLIAESERRAQALRELVQRMLQKQGRTYTDATDIYAMLREGKLEVDPETRAQAQKDIAQDGYWGVEQTAERLFSFAKALTGGDTSKADEMIEAVKKGYEQATKAWGGALPEISKRTLEAAIKKLEAWRDGTDSSKDMEDTAAKTFKNQTAYAKVAE